MEFDVDLYQPLFRKRLFISNREYHMRRTQEQGEQDLVGLSRRAKREDGWVYLPSKQIWVHIPTKHSEIFTDETSRMSVQPFMIIEGGEGQVHYHLHPENIYVRTLGERFPNGSSNNERLARDAIHGLLALPSKKDLENCEDPNVRYRIASPKGITSFRLNSGQAPESFLARDLTKQDLELLRRKGFGFYIQELIDRVKKRSHADLELEFRRV